MSEKNTQLGSGNALDNFDDLEYNARKMAHSHTGGVNYMTQENVIGVLETPVYNLGKMSIGEIKQWTGLKLANGTIGNRLKNSKIMPDRMTGKYNLADYTRDQVINVLRATLAPRPDAIEKAGSIERYNAELSLRGLNELLDKGGFKNSSEKGNQF